MGVHLSMTNVGENRERLWNELKDYWVFSGKTGCLTHPYRLYKLWGFHGFRCLWAILQLHELQKIMSNTNYSCPQKCKLREEECN